MNQICCFVTNSSFYLLFLLQILFLLLDSSLTVVAVPHSTCPPWSTQFALTYYSVRLYSFFRCFYTLKHTDNHCYPWDKLFDVYNYWNNLQIKLERTSSLLHPKDHLKNSLLIIFVTCVSCVLKSGNSLKKLYNDGIINSFLLQVA